MTPLFFKAIKPAGKPRIAGNKLGAGKSVTMTPPPMDNFANLISLLSERKIGGDFGPHNVKAGHHVAFHAGSYAGAGKVSACGRDGLTVADESEREHRIHWREVTGHFAPDGGDDEPEPDGIEPKEKAAGDAS